MSRDEGFGAAILALVMGGAIAIGVAVDVTGPLCDAAKITSMAPDKIEFGCFEFWLNRYQSAWAQLIAAAVAIIAAGVAWKAVQAQIEAQNKATQISELEFWQSRLDNSEAAFVGLSLMKTNLVGLQGAIDQQKGERAGGILAVKLLELSGNYPFEEIDTSRLGIASGFYMTFVAKLKGQMARLAANPTPEITVITNQNLIDLFNRLPTVVASIDNAIARNEEMHARADEALRRIENR